MTESLTLKNIALRFLNRIANPSFENKAIAAFLISGFAFVYFSQPLNIDGRIKLNLGFLTADFGVGNDPNWYLFSLGLAFIVYGGFALYKIKLSPSESRHKEIGNLLLLIEQKKSSLRNAQIQQFFFQIFKIKPTVPAIEHLLAADDPIGIIYDYRYAGHFVEFNNHSFVAKHPPIYHSRRISVFSFAYYIFSFIALICWTIPSVLSIEASTNSTHSSVWFFLAIIFGIPAAFSLNPIRAHSAALRLILSPCGESAEKKKDSETVIKLLSEIHTPTFDSFIHYGRMHFFYGNIIHFWEGFNAKVGASSFHIHNHKLRNVVADLHKSWRKSLSFGSYFVDTNNVSLQKFGSHYDIFRDKDAGAAHEAFIIAVNTTDKMLRELLTIVRSEFPEIDLDATNEIALNDYRSYQIAEI